MLAFGSVCSDNWLSMSTALRNAEALRNEALSVLPEEVETVVNGIKDALANKRIEAYQQSLTVGSRYSLHTDGNLITNSNRRFAPKFSEIVFPLEQRDVVRFFVELGYGEEYGVNRWEGLVFPERFLNDDPNSFPGPSKNRRLGDRLRDIYPVELLTYELPLSRYHEQRRAEARERAERTRTEYRDPYTFNYHDPYIIPESAIIDAVSLKSYLAWLDDRDEMYGIALGQHFSNQDRSLWWTFINWAEEKAGETFPINEEAFGHWDGLSDYLLWRETGRVAAASLLTSQKPGNKRLGNGEWALALRPAPVSPTELCDDIWYIPDDERWKDLPKDQNLLCLADFQSAACGDKNGTAAIGTACFSAGLRAILETRPDHQYAAEEQVEIALDIHFPGWRRDRLFIPAARIYDLLFDPESPWVGRVSRQNMHRLLTQAKMFDNDYERQPEDAALEKYDPALDAEINLDDPDLK